MNLQTIDKTRYRKHLMFVYIGWALGMILITVPLASLLAYLFGSEGESNNVFDIISAIISAIIVILFLNKNRNHPFLLEVAYVWDLKQQLNRIQRKQKAIDNAAKNGNHDALIILNYQYRGSKQLYQLDNNVITLDELNLKISANDAMLDAAGLSHSTDLFKSSMLDIF